MKRKLAPEALYSSQTGHATMGRSHCEIPNITADHIRRVDPDGSKALALLRNTSNTEDDLPGYVVASNGTIITDPKDGDTGTWHFTRPDLVMITPAEVIFRYGLWHTSFFPLSDDYLKQISKRNQDQK